jgi:1,4-dihydroxy-2-naphthoate octaprenyltransferase
MTILIGKHIDQMDFDSGKGIRTLPVLIGAHAARALNIAAVCASYGIVAILIGLEQLTPFAAAVILATPRARNAIEIMSRPRPAMAPAGYVGWPLWYHRACLRHNRIFGWSYIGGLFAAALWRAI